jgi:RimK family alpha-L-glutamate ligase
MAFGHPTVAVVAWKALPSNQPLIDSWRRCGIAAELMSPGDACRRLGPGDVALVRLDVTPTLDGAEAGVGDLAVLSDHGVRVLNRPGPLLAAHDKWQTARRLAAAGVAHPRTAHLTSLDDLRAWEPPFVLKPRFGSWGADVLRCRDQAEIARSAAILRERTWFRRHGVLVQELVPPRGIDLRVIIAGDRVVGGERRHAAPGEWRTNEALGGHARPAVPTELEGALAIAAARAIGADFVGIDLLPLPDGGYTVIEVNSALDFNHADDSLPGRDIYADVADALGLMPPVLPVTRRSRPRTVTTGQRSAPRRPRAPVTA